MKTLATIAVIAFSATSFNAWSQDDDKKEKELEKTQESERARSTQGIITENELKDDKGEVQSNEYRKSKEDSSSEMEGEVIEPNKDQGPESNEDSSNESDTTQNRAQRNTPVVIQHTSSESGSPAVLSGNNGKDRDGTNNVQRATPNMAGAKEPGNMNLSEKNGSTRTQKPATEKKIRQQEKQPAQIRDTKKTDATETMPPPEQDQQSGVLKENTPLEPVPATVTTAKEERKAKRKNRRNRRKD